MVRIIVPLLACGWLIAAPQPAAPAAQPPKPFRARIVHGTEGGLDIIVSGFSNDTMIGLCAGKAIEVPRALVKTFTWDKPTPMAEADTLSASNRFDAVLDRLALFATKDFVRFPAPATMRADTIVGMVADAYIRLGQPTNALRYLDGATNTAELAMLRGRANNRLGDYAGTIALLSPLKGDETQPIRLLGEIHYELGMALMNTATNYDDALDTLLAVKVFYRPDIESIARTELAAVQCYRGMNEFARAARVLSNILANAAYAVVSNEAAAALAEVTEQIAHDSEVKRRFGD